MMMASGVTHARALVAWLKLDADLWDCAAYGDDVAKDYDRIVVVRPVEGATQEHFLYILTTLSPKVKSPDRIIPLYWSYDDRN